MLLESFTLSTVDKYSFLNAKRANCLKILKDSICTYCTFIKSMIIKNCQQLINRKLIVWCSNKKYFHIIKTADYISAYRYGIHWLFLIVIMTRQEIIKVNFIYYTYFMHKLPKTIFIYWYLVFKIQIVTGLVFNYCDAPNRHLWHSNYAVDKMQVFNW